MAAKEAGSIEEAPTTMAVAVTETGQLDGAEAFAVIWLAALAVLLWRGRRVAMAFATGKAAV